ncbi:GGDEF domain-containing protein [Thiomicrorhabdus sp. zzn3]|uniref:GGDEF domain-containing protein n=1 Tax=Thiomicrorhabdus sp. zzn3 TaxID=3039775 RepID=UPI0024368C0A|nr:GGDEF domain-containing protein [Thiomicrorhabdus sp. zzn3]MDG6777218.1 GGDEF domain-containing protein [Thiomicrorhabdus sp. zzn3]
MVDCIQFDTSSVHEQLKFQLSGSALGRELLSIFSLKNLTTVYQPIIDLNKQKVFGFEALTRGPENSPLYRPLHLFHVAEEHDCLFEMDWLARQIAIEKYHDFGNKELLFVNVTVNALMQSSHRRSMTLECLKSLGIDVSQVVIEITELQPVEDFELFVKSISYYREMGFKVAIDDLGGGYNGLRIWSEVKPDFVKIDKHFISNLASDRDKQRFIETICALAKGLKTKIIAEGVEDEATLKVLEKFGVDYVQGYLFKRPQSVPDINLEYKWSKSRFEALSREETAACLLKESPCVLPDVAVSDVTELFLKESCMDYLPVVNEDNEVVGMIWRRELMDLLAHRYGRDLHQRKPVNKVMDTAPIVIDVYTPLVELSRIVTDYEGGHRGDVFIITENAHYRGCGRFVDLLRVMTDLKVQSAQYANPLSGLPGNVPIQNSLKAFMQSDAEFMVIYADLDHFKPFNDHYSFEKGDDVIRLLSEILQKHVKNGKDFVGHIGGDDFMIISSRVKKYQQLCEAVLQEFRDGVLPFYDERDRQRGGIVSKDRDDQESFFPIMSLSLGVLIVAPGAFSHQQMLTSYATKAKKLAKSQGGNTFAVIHSDTISA